MRNGTFITLAPLTEDDTTRLVAGLLEATAVPTELAQPIIQRAEGNPLYAEEFVRLLRDRDLLVRTEDGWQLSTDAEVPRSGRV
jgi:predicted ATPase